LFGRRLTILLCAVLLAGLMLVARLAQMQLGWRHLFVKEDYTRASGSHLVETVRGGIFTRWGTPLARQVAAFGVGVHFAKLAENDWQGPVSRLCGVPVEKLNAVAAEKRQWVEQMEARVQARQMEREGRADIRVAERYQYHCVLEDVSPEVAALIRTEPGLLPTVRVNRTQIPAVVVLERTRREYENGSLCPHVVGRVAPVSPETWESLVKQDLAWTMGQPFSQLSGRYAMDDRLGVSGVEKSCARALRGSRGYVLNYLVFGVLSIARGSVETPPERGRDVYLTIREDFQRAANAALARAAGEEELDFKSGALVFIDVRDGAVLAAATYPSYNLSTYGDDFGDLLVNPHHPLLFRPTQAALPTGSVYKVVTATAALEEGAIVSETTFTCHGSQVFGNRSWDCASRWGHGTLSLVPAIEHSCNVYFYNAGVRVGGEALARWGRAFGLGMPTGVDLPYARSGRLPEPRSMFGTLNLSIGQGQLLCTPLQVANMMAAVANGGRLHTPHFLDHARDVYGDVAEAYEPDSVQVPVKEATLAKVREGLRLVIESGTARRALLDPYRAAGKTGTAETGVTKVFHAWFAGYLPHDDPKVAFALVSERTSLHGGEIAVIVRYALEQLWDDEKDGLPL